MKITLTWGDGEHDFNLRLGEIRELQQKTGVGPFALYRRIRARDWFVDDLREVIRLGLIGGGKENIVALNLIKNNFDGKPLAPQEEVAVKVMAAFFLGDEEISVGKPEVAKDKNEQTTGSPLPQSTETVT